MAAAAAAAAAGCPASPARLRPRRWSAAAAPPVGPARDPASHWPPVLRALHWAPPRGLAARVSGLPGCHLGVPSRSLYNSPEIPFLPPLHLMSRRGLELRLGLGSQAPRARRLRAAPLPPATSGFNPPRRVQRQLRLPTEGPRELSASAWVRDPTTPGCLNRSPWPQLQVPFPGRPAWAAFLATGPRGRSHSNPTTASEAQQFQAPHRLSLTFVASPVIGIAIPNLPGLGRKD